MSIKVFIAERNSFSKEEFLKINDLLVKTNNQPTLEQLAELNLLITLETVYKLNNTAPELLLYHPYDF